ncbi:MAG: CynX/NimT family MFS transporter, partial [Acidimicrobiales bacterium]
MHAAGPGVHAAGRGVDTYWVKTTRPAGASTVASRKVLLAAAFLLATVNLRPAIVAVSPVLGTIRHAMGLSPTVAGLLTTLPLVCFGVVALISPRVVGRAGAGALMMACLLGLCAGTVLRSVPGVGLLFAGTFVVGVSVAVANVLMPGVVKEDFSGRVGLMTGLYTMALSAGPSLSAGLTVPLERALGGSWRLAIGFWALPVLLAALCWAPFRRHGRPADDDLVSTPRRHFWRDPTAWSVTLFMGVEALEFYAVLAWLPTILHSRGISVVASGTLLSLVAVVGIGSSLVTPMLANRMRDQRFMIVMSTLCTAVGLAGLLAEPHHLVLVWSVVLGLGQGSAIALALMMIVLRTSTTAEANALSCMAQGVGYLIAATGPALVGGTFGLTGSWDVPLAVLLVLLIAQMFYGWRAGRDKPAQPQAAVAAQLS